MKYLQDYIEDKQTKCLEKHGVFFAFSDKQFDEGKKEGVKYVSLGSGTLCPKTTVDAFVEDHHKIVMDGMAQDLKENTKDGVILRELFNHECFYTGDYEDCMDSLESYGITEEEIQKVYFKELPNQSEDY